MTHGQLLRTVWGEAHLGDIEYLRGLRIKLEDNPNEPILLQNEPGIGYRLVGD